MGFERHMQALPDIRFCIEQGWIKPAIVPDRGFTAAHQPRKYRKVRLSTTEYMREYRERMWARGLTSHGTLPKRRKKS